MDIPEDTSTCRKKLSGPEKLLPFPWDKDMNKKAQEDLEKNTAAAVAFLGGQDNG